MNGAQLPLRCFEFEGLEGGVEVAAAGGGAAHDADIDGFLLGEVAHADGHVLFAVEGAEGFDGVVFADETPPDGCGLGEVGERGAV